MLTINQINLHRIFTAPVKKLYKAFTKPDALATWIPPYGFICKIDFLNLKIGGIFRMSFTNFSTGNSHSFGGEYLKIITNELLEYFDDSNLPGKIITTVKFNKVFCGTELIIN